MSNLIKKLLYRSNHRGTKEMDLLIGGFAIENLKKLNPEELKEFELLLNFTDKELSSWLVDNKKNIDLENFSISKKIKEFKPEFILLSAGFDAHKDDPLAQINLESKDYYTLTKRILTIAKKLCDGKVVSILEGGYDLNALKESVDYHVKSLLE